MILREGRVLGGRYRAVRMLGRGGMGEVWLCDDVDRGGHVAVKAVRPDLLSGDEPMRLFHGEVLAAARLCHPGIVAVYDLLRLGDEGTFLVMAYRPGHPLSALLSGIRHFSFVREVVRQILAALAYAHARGVLHLDIKPDNVIAETKPGAVRTTLVDFGIARVRTPGTGIEKWLERDAVLGTLAYMAPEQCAGRIEQFGPWTDLYAVGAMGYEMCAGHAPHDDLAGPRAVFRRLTEPAPALRPIVHDVPAEFVELCAWLLATEPRDRPAYAADVLRALDEMETGPIVVPEPSAPGARTARSSKATAKAGDALGAGSDSNLATAESAATVATRRPAVDSSAATGPAPVATAPTQAAGPAAPRAPAVAAFLHERTTGALLRDAVAEYARTLPSFGAETEPEPGAYGLFGLRELPVIGRETERETLWRAVRAAIVGAEPYAVLLEGPAGAGKTRLARDALERSHELGLCSVMQTAWSTDASGDEGIRGLVENLLDSRGVAAEGVRRRLRFWLERHGEPHPAFAREVELLLRPPPEAAPDAELPVRVAVDAIERAAAARPVLLWLDDVQWSRGEAAALLRALASRATGRQADGLAVCVVATARIEEAEESARCDELLAILGAPRASRVEMGELDDTAARRLVRGLLDVDDELCAFLAARAEGNPLFVTQLLAELVDAETVERREGRYRLAREIDLNAVPANIGALWDRRLARSGGDVGDLSALALTRDRVPLAVATELGRRLGRSLQRSIDRAAEHGLLRVAGGNLAWVHGLLRDHLVAQIAATERPALHAAAASAFEPLVGSEDVQEERARHLFAAGAADPACSAMLDAVAWSERRAENDARRRRIDALLAWSAPEEMAPHRVRALAELGYLLAQIGQREEADTPIADAMELADAHGLDPPWLHVRRGQVARLQGRMDAGAEAAEAALQAARRDGDVAAEALTLAQMGNAALRMGERTSAVQRLEEAAALFRQLGDRAGQAMTLCFVANITDAGRLELFDRALELASAAGALSAELSVRQVRLSELWELGRSEEARAEAAAVVGEARRRGLRQTVSLTELTAGCWALKEVDVDRAEQHLRAALDAGATTGAAPERATAAALSVAVAAAAGCDVDARRALADLVEARRSYDDEFLRRVLMWAAEVAGPDLGAYIRSLVDTASGTDA